MVEQHEYGYPAVVLRCNQGGRCKNTMTRRSICFGLITNPTTGAVGKKSWRERQALGETDFNN